jgi:thioredoxin 1
VRSPLLEAKNLDTLSREEDLKVILEKTFFKEDRFDKMAAVFLTQRVNSSENAIPLEILIDRLRQILQTKPMLKQLMVSYQSFSDEEIHELREIFENEVFDKYLEDSFLILESNMQVMDQVLNTMLQGQPKASQKSTQKMVEDFSSKWTDAGILEITKENFHEEVEEFQQPVILEVYANWCRPCHEFTPIFENLYQKYKKVCRFGKVNSDEETLLMSFLKVKAYPTTVFLHKGKVISREVGNMSKEKLEAKIQDFLQNLKETEEND